MREITLTEFIANVKMTCGSSFYGRDDGNSINIE